MNPVNHTSAATTGPLRPCPFCGEHRISLNKPNAHDRYGSINCPACLMVLPGACSDEGELIRCWNARSDGAAQRPSMTARRQASKILFGDIHWLDREDMADQMDNEFTQDDGSHQRNISPNALIAELEAAQPPAAPVEETNYDNANSLPVAWIAFAGSGNIRLWTADEGRAKDEKARGLDMRAFTLAELVALASKGASPSSAATVQAHYSAFQSVLIRWMDEIKLPREHVARLKELCEATAVSIPTAPQTLSKPFAVSESAECGGCGGIGGRHSRGCPTVHDELDQLREALEDTSNWLEGCLQCKTWAWDGLQRDAAEQALKDAREALVVTRPQSGRADG